MDHLRYFGFIAPVELLQSNRTDLSVVVVLPRIATLLLYR
jgi:hypothetical protein